MMRTNWLISGSCAVVAALALAGCGSSGSSSASAKPADSPLSKLFGWNVSPAEQKAQQLKIDEAVTRCMTSEGWEYKPYDFSPSNDVYAEENLAQQADPVAWGKKYGYGVVRYYELNEQVNDGGGNTFVDPNQKYLDSLTQSERTSYDETLYGKQPTEPTSVDSEGNSVYEPPPLDQQGCQGKAQLEVNGDQPINDSKVQNRLNELFTDQQNDPAIAAANKVWVACMADLDSSYDFKAVEDASNGLYEKLNALQGFDIGPADTVSAAGLVQTVTTEVTIEGGDGTGGPGEQKKPTQAQLDDLRKEELKVWNDDQVCQKKADIIGVRSDLEQKMVDLLIKEFPELASKAKG